jgi:hypothetical protein
MLNCGITAGGRGNELDGPLALLIFCLIFFGISIKMKAPKMGENPRKMPSEKMAFF